MQAVDFKVSFLPSSKSLRSIDSLAIDILSSLNSYCHCLAR